MYICPHCGQAITQEELFSKRLLRERICNACGGGYTDGGTTVAFAAIAVAGTLAGYLNRTPAYPKWSVWIPLAVGGAVVLFSTIRSQPIKSSAIRAKLVELMIIVPMASVATWKAIDWYEAWLT